MNCLRKVKKSDKKREFVYLLFLSQFYLKKRKLKKRDKKKNIFFISLNFCWNLPSCFVYLID